MTQTLLKKAEQFCEDNTHRLTQPRREVLKIISSSKKPIGAYDILKKLGKTLKDPKPPTAYRAIDFWQEHGFIHRIESLNAFVSCLAGHNHEGSQFMVFYWQSWHWPWISVQRNLCPDFAWVNIILTNILGGGIRPCLLYTKHPTDD